MADNKYAHYILEGRIKTQRSHAGVADLLVVALDLDAGVMSGGQERMVATPRDYDEALRYDRLGSVLTDGDGRFVLEFTEQDFRLSGAEARPDIVLMVHAPEVAETSPTPSELLNPLSMSKNLIHLSPPIRLKAGRREAYSIRIPDAVMEKHGLVRGRGELKDPEAHKQKLEARAKNFKALLDNRVANFSTYLNADWLRGPTDELFAGFTLSRVPPEHKAKDTFLAPGDDVKALVGSVMARGITKYADQARGRRLKLKLSRPELLAAGLLDARGELPPSLTPNELYGWWDRKADPVLERARSPYEPCLVPYGEDGGEPGAGPPGGGSPPAEGPPREPFSASDYAAWMMSCSTCPEEPLSYGKLIDPDYRGRELRNTITGFELVSGPTDVTSFHDFKYLQIAFETIWTEALDESIGELAKELFAEIVRTHDDADCAEAFVRASPAGLRDPTSLKSLLTQYRAITGNSNNARLNDLFGQLEARLAEPYKFDVFATNSINYGLMFTFRQQWEPGSYQAGRLVKTVPLAPKEERRYSTKTTRKVSRTQRILEDRELKGRNESQSTSRAESEIISRATQKNSFTTNTQGGVNAEMYNMQFGMTAGMDSEKFSSSTKKNFRESVVKAAQEYREQVKLEVQTSSEDVVEATNSGVIVNPNDEIAVTYLFYQLQRQYEVSEQLHRIAPVVMVAFDVPKPNEIDNDWLMTHGWILRRVLLDESFQAALDYLMESSAGAEIALQELGGALKRQQKLVDELNRQLELKNQSVESLMDVMMGLMTGDAVVQTIKDVGDFINGMMNPFAGLMGGGDSGPDLEKLKGVMEVKLEHLEKEQRALADRLREAQSELRTTTTKFSEATREHFDKQTAIAQLRIHIKENILYYMQAIWDHEPPDQRYFRLYDLDIDWVQAPSTPIDTAGLEVRRNEETGEIEFVEGSVALPMGNVVTPRKLVDVADLDNLLGFKGNYAVFPVRELSYLHLHMMQDYIDDRTRGLRDADAFADLSTQELIDYLECLREKQPARYEEERDQLIEIIHARQRSPRKEKELVIVPTDSLFIECLPGKHPVLEDFKLVHRAIDVKKVQAEVRQVELENARYAARLVAGERDDPDLDKLVRIDGGIGGVDVET